MGPVLAEASGALAAAMAAPIAVASWLPHGLDWPALPWSSMAAIGSALCLSSSSVLIARTVEAGRWMAVIGIVAGVAAAAELLAASPLIAMMALIGAILAIARLWAPRTLFGRLLNLAHPSADVARARGASIAATELWLGISLQGAAPGLVGQVCMAASFLVAWGLIGRWLVRERRTRRLRAVVRERLEVRDEPGGSVFLPGPIHPPDDLFVKGFPSLGHGPAPRPPAGSQ